MKKYIGGGAMHTAQHYQFDIICCELRCFYLFKYEAKYFLPLVEQLCVSKGESPVSSCMSEQKCDERKRR